MAVSLANPKLHNIRVRRVSRVTVTARPQLKEIPMLAVLVLELPLGIPGPTLGQVRARGQ
jgi:hypothetical protein